MFAKKYFYSASIVCLASNPEATLKDIMDCLIFSDCRERTIKEIPSDRYGFLSEYIEHLLTLDVVENQINDITDSYCKHTFNKTSGLISKLELIKKSPLLNNLFLNKCDKALDFEDIFSKRKSILIKASSCTTDNKYTKDFISMFFLLKTLTYCKNKSGSIESQDKFKDLNRIHFSLNQEYNLPQTYKYLMRCLPEMRMFCVKPIIIVSNINQLGDGLKSVRKNINIMRDIGVNYMFLSGDIDQCYYELFENQSSSYSIDDIRSLKKFHTFNIVRGEHGYETFITALPSPFLD